ncbi:MAG: L-histidine N(alpha)-methyltransferase [Fimbriimonadales bacterium]
MHQPGELHDSSFESKAQARSLWDWLKRGAVPLKFAYVGSAAVTHDVLAHHSSYDSVGGPGASEADLVKRTVEPDLVQELCEIGPGNGLHSRIFLAALRESAWMPPRYLGLDFSNELLQLTSGLLAGHFPRMEVQVGNWDIETGPTRAIRGWRSLPSLLVICVGNTLGNVEDEQVVLRHIADSLEPTDRLLLTVALRGIKSVRSILAPYKADYFEAAALEPLAMGGLDLGKGEFEIRWNEASSCVEGWFICRHSMSTKYAGEELAYRPGDSIRCFLSRRFTAARIEELVFSGGWSIRGKKVTREGDSDSMILSRGA